ncbi:MAG TPA: hypothetical protein VMQ45_15225 [Burkholderiaceae bacterium]|jgi:hypothetical protein|nr:hypothetical protein [Burkholderiaceae bacterium]
MASRPAREQIAFRYRAVDSEAGVTRKTTKRLAEALGLDETQAIHKALRELAVRVLPQYEADDGPLTVAQLRQIRKRVPQGTKRSVRSSVLDTETT